MLGWEKRERYIEREKGFKEGENKIRLSKFNRVKILEQ